MSIKNIKIIIKTVLLALSNTIPKYFFKDERINNIFPQNIVFCEKGAGFIYLIPLFRVCKQ
ncbi:MAG: hypothetical protein GWO87_02370 [Xanthomonadaceae bacterium]|nr:hypothetical protein [Rhodospirillaceae bacterium]NIA18012.1 hypothetical protein [Xanthomonadaceae bacterium]